MGLAMAVHHYDAKADPTTCASWFDTLMDEVESIVNPGLLRRTPDDDAFYQMCIDRLERAREVFEEMRAESARERADVRCSEQ
jgi:hypothetical protein